MTGRPIFGCGTEPAYRRHLAHHEPIDQACREAHRLYNAQEKARRNGHRQPRAEDDACGTPRGLRRHYMRGEPVCDACREADNAEQRRRRAAKRRPVGEQLDELIRTELANLITGPEGVPA